MGVKCRALGRHSLLLLFSLFFGKGKTQVLLPQGSWQADRGQARGEGESEVSVGGTGRPSRLPAVASWGEQQKGEPSLSYPPCLVGSSVGRPGAQQ